MLAIETPGVPSVRSTAREYAQDEAPAEALTVREFMRIYKLGRSSVYKLIRAKKLQSRKVLGKRLILAASAKALLDPDEPGMPITAQPKHPSPRNPERSNVRT